MCGVQMVVCVAIVSTGKKKTSSLIPPYKSSVNMFDDNIIWRLAVLISEFHAATVTLLHPNWQRYQFISVRGMTRMPAFRERSLLGHKLWPSPSCGLTPVTPEDCTRLFKEAEGKGTSRFRCCCEVLGNEGY